MKNRLLRFGSYVAVGVATGLLVAALVLLAERVLLAEVLELDWRLQAMVPAVGLWAAVLTLRWADAGKPLGGQTAELYIASFHDADKPLRLRNLPARLAAGIFTVGSGGAVGLEGPSVYAGATLGSSSQGWLKNLFRSKQRQALLVAGAAAGISAVFQAPATGVLFALEVPYKSDIGRRALLPALFASATSFVTFELVASGAVVPFAERTGLVTVGFGRIELLGAAIVGALCGLGAAVFARVLAYGRKVQQQVKRWWLLALGGSAILAALVYVSDVLFGEPLTLGPDTEGALTEWVLAPDTSLLALGALLAARAIATTTVISAGGVGGVFIPLAVFGLIVGRLVGGWIGVSDESLAFFPFIGVAAFLSAGYRTPLAAVMFVAESSGAASYVVPGLVAVAVSQVLIGGASVSHLQRDSRIGHLERRMEMPVTSALLRSVPKVKATAPISEFMWSVALPQKQTEAVVVDDHNRYLGVIGVADLAEVDRDKWQATPVSEVMVTDIEPARASWTLGELTLKMAEVDIEAYPVVDAANRVVGVVTENAIVKMVDVLAQSQPS